MIRRVALAALAAMLMAGRSEACPEPSRTILWHSCWGQASVDLLLLPEDLPLPQSAREGTSLLVTGAYTGREPRGDGRPDPVGLFVRRGEVIGRNMAPMDGILLIDPEGAARLEHRRAVEFDGGTYDLGSPPERRRFLDRAAATGFSVLQSHLIVIQGAGDVSADVTAPAYVRRVLFEDADGLGLYESLLPVTLHDAAATVVREHGARMALNLDMGSYDFCLRLTADRSPENCGVVGTDDDMAKLSNLLVLSLRPDGL